MVSSFSESNIIIAGNPAREIGTWNEFREKYQEKAVFRTELDDIIRGSIDKLVQK